MTASLKTTILNALRMPLRHPSLEAVLVGLTKGKAATSVIARMLPRHHQYGLGTVRPAVRYGIEWPALELSELIGWYLFFGLHDPSHEDFLGLVEPGNVVIDVGANIGLTALRAAGRCGPAGRVIALEPDPLTFAKLTAALERNPLLRVEAHQVAVGETTGTLLLEVRDPHNLGMNRISKQGTVPVEVTTIDRLVEQLELSRVDVIKVDTEGFEPNVLRGAAATIARHRPRLFLELDDGNLRDQGGSSASLLAQLDALGYDCTRCDGKSVTPADALVGAHTDLVCRPR